MFDSCVNLLHSAFDKDRAALLRRAVDAGLKGALLCSTDLESSIRAANAARELKKEYPLEIYTMAGIHPHEAHSWRQETVSSLRDLIRRHSEYIKVLGETGLDYARLFSTREQQRAAFVAQLELAIDLKLPVFLHQRNSHDDFLHILGARAPRLAAMLVHCFTGSAYQLESYLELGCYIGITGWLCDERRGAHLPSLVSVIPKDKLIVETDSPYLIPRSLPAAQRKNNRNEPAYLKHIIDKLAAHLSWDVRELTVMTQANAIRFLHINAATIS